MCKLQRGISQDLGSVELSRYGSYSLYAVLVKHHGQSWPAMIVSMSWCLFWRNDGPLFQWRIVIPWPLCPLFPWIILAFLFLILVDTGGGSAASHGCGRSVKLYWG